MSKSRHIVYLSPFPTDLISGGIKVMFRHVEMLTQMGFDASVYSPQGAPQWMNSAARLYGGKNPALDADNLMVFPEILTGQLGQAARTATPAAKALLCQNQYFVFNETIPNHTFAELGFVKLLTVGEVARSFLERALAPARFDVVPVWIDDATFFPREKALRIALFPRKLAKQYALIRQIFVLKYPQFRHVPWDLIASKNEREAAETLGRAAIFLSLCELECVPLTPLEAMASGCIVVGFHGYGGLEYATASNGVWIRPDYLEETADALADAIRGIELQDPHYAHLRTGALETAQRFNVVATRAALRRTFDALDAS